MNHDQCHDDHDDLGNTNDKICPEGLDCVFPGFPQVEMFNPRVVNCHRPGLKSRTAGNLTCDGIAF